jgi:hypothetical protein
MPRGGGAIRLYDERDLVSGSIQLIGVSEFSLEHSTPERPTILCSNTLEAHRRVEP